MDKNAIKSIINNAIEKRQLCRLIFDYDENSWVCFPLLANDRLILCANEEDFILNGYTIRSFDSVVEAEEETGKIYSMIKSEGIIEKLKIPELDIYDWESVFVSLAKLNRFIIVENEKADEDEKSFVIGRVIEVTDKKVIMQHFDADGIWESEFYEMSYEKITSVSINTRYSEVFFKYM